MNCEMHVYLWGEPTPHKFVGNQPNSMCFVHVQFSFFLIEFLSDNAYDPVIFIKVQVWFVVHVGPPFALQSIGKRHLDYINILETSSNVE